MTRRYVSPLRYPGGKATLAARLQPLVDATDAEVWMEPYAGGLGAGLALLDDDAVGEVWFSERDPGLAGFWQYLLTDPQDLAEQVAATVPTVELFDASRAVLTDTTASVHELGYATFVVNRCSRSGIIHPRSGVIGGREQAGKYRVGDRFPAQALAERITYVAQYRHRLRFLGHDGVQAIRDLTGSGIEDEVFVFADPPYIHAGPDLYRPDARTPGRDMHQDLAYALGACPSPWALTYDQHPRVPQLYAGARIQEFALRYSAARVREAGEYLVTPVWLPAAPLDPPATPPSSSTPDTQHPAEPEAVDGQLPGQQLLPGL